MQIVLLPDDDRKAETCSKFIAYGASIQIIALLEPNDKYCLTHNMTQRYNIFNRLKVFKNKVLRRIIHSEGREILTG
jgi:hypothetical protein